MIGLVEGPDRAVERSTSQMKKRIGSYPRVRIEGGGRAVVSQAGGVLLVETVRKRSSPGSPSGAGGCRTRSA